MGNVWRTYYRVESPTQTFVDASRQMESGEIWGKPARGSFFPKVKAYEGALPEGKHGIEFMTDVEPDDGSPPGQACWSVGHPGVRLEGEFAKLNVKVIRVVYPNAVTRV